jgi:hypothetical protein
MPVIRPPIPNTVSVVVTVSWSVILLGRAFDIGNTLISRNWKLITSSKQNLWPWGVGTGYGVTFITRDVSLSASVYSVTYVGHFWLHSKPPKLHKWSNYRNHLILWKSNCTPSPVHSYSSECTDGRVGKWELYNTLSVIRDFKYSNGSVATRKFLSVVHTCGEGWK